MHALEEKEKKGELVPGAILRSWDREGFLASRANDATAAMTVVPEDRQVVVLYLPLDGSQSKYLAAAARQMAAAGSPGKPTKFMIAKDAPSEAVLEELVRNSPAPAVQLAGIGSQVAGQAAANSTAQLETLAQLHASGALTDAEFEAQKAGSSAAAEICS